MNFVTHLDFLGVQAKEIPCIKGKGAPSPTTEATVGCLYMDESTGLMYKCTEASNGKSVWVQESTVSIVKSAKHKPFTKIVDDCQALNANNVPINWNVSLKSDTTIPSIIDTNKPLFGTHSLRSDSSMRSSKKHTYDVLNNDLVVKLKINSINSGTSLYIQFRNSNNASKAIVYELDRASNWTTPHDWVEIVIPYNGYSYMSSGCTLADFDLTQIDDLMITTNSGGKADWNLQYIGLRPKTSKRGIVTFTFDDGYKSQYTGAKVLAEKGITSTIFGIFSWINTSGQHVPYEVADVLTPTEFQELVNYYGTDIEVHGHYAYLTPEVPEQDRGPFNVVWTEDTLKEHWEDSKKYLKENGLSEGKYMAYPNGAFPDSIVQLTKSYFDSCRTIKPFIPMEAFPPSDNYRVRAISGISGNGSVNVAKVKEYIDRAVASNSWLVLVFHRIEEGTNDTNDCSIADLRAIADYAINSGANIMNYAEAFESGLVQN